MKEFDALFTVVLNYIGLCATPNDKIYWARQLIEKLQHFIEEQLPPE